MGTKDFIKQQMERLISENKRLINEYASLFNEMNLNSANAERIRDMAELLEVSTVAANNLFTRSNDLCQVCHTEDEIGMESTFNDYNEKDKDA